MMSKHNVLGIALTLALLISAPPAWAQTVTEGYELVKYPSLRMGGQFTAYNGEIHYWETGRTRISNNYPGGSYHVYNVATGVDTNYGGPSAGVLSNGGGDPFGVLDPVNKVYYVATYKSPDHIYTYDLQTQEWNTTGPAGVGIKNAFGGQVHNGQLYIGGLNALWNGGTNQDNYIFAFDHSANPGETGRHDALIKTAGMSAYIAVAPNGDIYYATYVTLGNSTLYRWTAAQVASVRDDLYADDAVDRYLTLADAVQTWSLPGSGAGLTVDAGGNIFFTVNEYDWKTWDTISILGMIDASAPGGYRELVRNVCDDFGTWFGAISVDGDFLKGDTLYFTPTMFGGSGMWALTGPAVPEPTTMALLALAGVAALRCRRR